MDINWFPGHMAKALRNIKEHLPMVDVVVETCDARIPRSSRNPALARILADKPQILVFNKADLADPKVTEEWVRYYSRHKLTMVPCNSKNREGFRRVTEEAYKLVAEKLDRIAARGRDNRPLRLMVVGIPNTGKSTLINSMSGRKAAQTSDRPGVTRGPQWVRSKDTKLEWLDMPGVLWPKLETDEQKLSLSATGAIKDQVLPIEEVSFFLFRKLLELCPEYLRERYRLRHMESDPYDIYLEGARMRGCILSGGRVDEQRFAELFLNEFRGGMIGRISLETISAAEAGEDEASVLSQASAEVGTDGVARPENQEDILDSDEDWIHGSY